MNQCVYINGQALFSSFSSESFNFYNANTYKFFKSESDILMYYEELRLSKKSEKKNSMHISLALCASKICLNDVEDDYGAFDKKSVVLSTSCDELSKNDPLIEILKCSISDGEFDYTKCGTDGYRNMPPLYILGKLPNTAAGKIAIENEFTGMNYSIVNNSNGGLISVGEGFLDIELGLSDCCICGGITPRRSYIKDMINNNFNTVFQKFSFYDHEAAALLYISKTKAKNTYAEIVYYSSRQSREENLFNNIILELDKINAKYNIIFSYYNYFNIDLLEKILDTINIAEDRYGFFSNKKLGYLDSASSVIGLIEMANALRLLAKDNEFALIFSVDELFNITYMILKKV